MGVLGEEGMGCEGLATRAWDRHHIGHPDALVHARTWRCATRLLYSYLQVPGDNPLDATLRMALGQLAGWLRRRQHKAGQAKETNDADWPRGSSAAGESTGVENVSGNRSKDGEDIEDRGDHDTEIAAVGEPTNNQMESRLGALDFEKGYDEVVEEVKESEAFAEVRHRTARLEKSAEAMNELLTHFANVDLEQIQDALEKMFKGMALDSMEALDELFKILDDTASFLPLPPCLFWIEAIYLFAQQLGYYTVQGFLMYYFTLLSVAFDLILVLTTFAPFSPAVDFTGVTYTILRSRRTVRTSHAVLPCL